jgi:hypothetical protein
MDSAMLLVSTLTSIGVVQDTAVGTVTGTIQHLNCEPYWLVSCPLNQSMPTPFSYITMHLAAPCILLGLLDS